MSNPYLDGDTAEIQRQSDLMRWSYRSAAAIRIAVGLWREARAALPEDATAAQKEDLIFDAVENMAAVNNDLKKLEQPDAHGSGPEVF